MNPTFEDIYKTYYTRVYHTALKVTKDASLAEDVLQESFMKVYDNMSEITRVEKIGAWLSTITTRTAIDFLRKEKKNVVLPVEELPCPHKDESTVGSEVEKRYEQKVLEEGVKQKVSTLSPKLRAVFKLNYYSYLREGEIAEKLHLSQSAVKSRLHRARRAMKEKMMSGINQDYTA